MTTDPLRKLIRRHGAHIGRAVKYVAGRVRLGHTLGDPERHARTITATAQAPPWFTVDANGWIPPHSDMTWRVDLPTGTSGETVLACTSPSRPRAWVATSRPRSRDDDGDRRSASYALDTPGGTEAEILALRGPLRSTPRVPCGAPPMSRWRGWRTLGT